LSFAADWHPEGAPEAPFPTFSLYFSLFAGKARFLGQSGFTSSRSCFGEASDGAPIITSSPDDNSTPLPSIADARSGDHDKFSR
jgi:hypothetical protein